MEDESWRKKRQKARFRHSNRRHTTPSANGISGWYCGNANWLPISIPEDRQSTREALREVRKNLQSRTAISTWMDEEDAR